LRATRVPVWMTQLEPTPKYAALHGRLERAIACAGESLYPAELSGLARKR
jgi:hypothetical protein